MSLAQAETLRPGQKLTWIGNKDRPASALCVYGGLYGETVSFIRRSGRRDDHGMPIIEVQTKKGAVRFSSGWFNLVV